MLIPLQYHRSVHHVLCVQRSAVSPLGWYVLALVALSRISLVGVLHSFLGAQVLCLVPRTIPVDHLHNCLCPVLDTRGHEYDCMCAGGGPFPPISF